MKSFEWAEAKSLEEALALQSDGAVFKAGGADLLDLMKEHIVEPNRLVNIRNLPDMRKMEESDGMLYVGPMVTLAEVADHPLVQKNYAALALACGHAATPQIRNMATIGGNLLQRPRCWYFRNELFPCRKKGGEICYAQQGENQYHAIFYNRLCAIVHPSAAACALVAMGALILITGEKGSREMKLEDFFVLPSADLHRENKLKEKEILTGIRIPVMKPGMKSFYIKEMEKQSFDWPIAEVAAVVEMEAGVVKSASVVLGAAAPIPYRAKQVEKRLIGKPLDEAAILDAVKTELKDATPLEQNKYKLPLFEAVVTRAVMQCV